MAKHVENLNLGDLTDKQFLVIATEAMALLGWRIKFISDVGFIGFTENGGHSWNGELTVKIEGEYANIQCISIGGVLEDFGRSKMTVERFISKFEEIKPTVTDEEVRSKYKQLKKDFLPAYEDTLKPAINPSFQTFKGLFSFFTPAKDYFVTPILIDLNLLIFFVMVCAGINVFEPDGESMIRWGANVRTLTLDGQWWRLVSNCFLHFGVFHLLLNMYALFYIGFLLEPYLGKARFLAAYLLTGITASLLSLWWHDFSISAGASGAIFGMYGVFLAMLTSDFIERSMRNGLLSSIGIFVVYNLVYGLKGGIDNAAHIGGLLGGIVIGYAYIPGLKKPGHLIFKKFTVLAVSLVILACSAVVYLGMAKSDRLAYDKGMKQFYATETRALEIFKQSDTLSKEDILLNLKNNGISLWERNSTLIKKLDQLQLSNELHERNKKILQYCKLRIQSYQLMYQETAESTEKYQPQLDEVNQKIKTLIDELSSKN